MNDGKTFEDQNQRNEMGFDITCQVSALLDMLKSERQRHEDMNTFGDLLDAVMPRLHDLNEAAMALFTDPVALECGEVALTVHGSRRTEDAA